MSKGSQTNLAPNENCQNAEWFVTSGLFERDLERYSNRTSVQKDELVQMVALSILQSENQPVDTRRRPAWVRTIIRRRAIDYVRQQAGNKECQSNQVLPQPDLDEPKPEQAKWKLFKKSLSLVVAENPEFRELLRFWWHSPTLIEHAELLGISIPQVRGLREKFKKRAREVMARLVSDHN